MLSRKSAPQDEELSDDEVLTLVKARLVPASYLPDSHREHFSYRRTVVNDLEAILMLDYPETTTAIPDSIVSRFDAESLWKTAIAAVSAESLEEVHTVDAGSGPFHLVATDSMFTASHVLDFPALLAQMGAPSAPQGVLFAVPSRHHLAFHVVQGVDAIQIVHGMYGFAQMTFGNGVGEISPNIYYWSEAGIEQVTSADESGNVAIDGTGAFFAAVNSF